MIGGHLNRRVPFYLVYLIQLSLKFFVVISLILHDHFGGRHAYLSWYNNFHSMGKGKKDGSN